MIKLLLSNWGLHLKTSEVSTSIVDPYISWINIFRNFTEFIITIFIAFATLNSAQTAQIDLVRNI
jgi:hypothetical protein